MGHAREMDVSISVVGLEVFLGTIACDTDRATTGERDHLDRLDEWEGVTAH